MSFKGLNSCLSEMDSLTKMDLSTDKLSMIVVFNCFDGGVYENVELEIEFKNPELIHIPFMANGEFKFIELCGDDRNDIIPAEFMEYDPKVCKLIINNNDQGFYLSYQDLDWSVSGAGTKNSKELAW